MTFKACCAWPHYCTATARRASVATYTILSTFKRKVNVFLSAFQVFDAAYFPVSALMSTGGSVCSPVLVSVNQVSLINKTWSLRTVLVIFFLLHILLYISLTLSKIKLDLTQIRIGRSELHTIHNCSRIANYNKCIFTCHEEWCVIFAQKLEEILTSIIFCSVFLGGFKFLM